MELLLSEKVQRELDNIKSYFNMPTDRLIEYCIDDFYKKFCENNDVSSVNDLIFKNATFSHENHEILEGVLFSDGCIAYHKNDSLKFWFGQTSRNAEYVFYVANLFGFKDKVKTRARFDTRYNKYNCSAEMKAFTSSFLWSYYNRWYPNKIKVIPQDFKITPLSLRHLYLGDGSIRKSYNQMIICTDSFKKVDIENIFMQQLFELGLSPTIFISQKDKPRVNISNKKSIELFFEYIGKCPVECFKYKWPPEFR